LHAVHGSGPFLGEGMQGLQSEGQVQSLSNVVIGVDAVHLANQIGF